MIPIVTPEEMSAIDAVAPEPVDVLIDRAGAAVARHAREMLGGTYGRRVVLVAGRGNNGNDGRVAAQRLRRRGAQVIEVDAAHPPQMLPSADLIIDAAYGTGLRRPFVAPGLTDPGTAVLAVDIASGLHGLTGEVLGAPLPADRTVTFAALKPGLLFGEGPALSGDVFVVDIGLDTGGARAHVVQNADVDEWVPPRPPDDHKWRSAVWVIGGSPGMAGAARLACGGAARGGAGYVRLSVPGGHDDGAPTEVVQFPLDADLTVGSDEVERFGAMVIGPGLGRTPALGEALARFVSTVECPLVIDGDALTLLGQKIGAVVAARTYPTVLTPHDGEYARLTGTSPDADRLTAARELAGATNSVVLLKGPTTVIADAAERALVSVTGDERLATAGTGDVLAGLVAALLARRVDPLLAAAAGAHLHGLAAQHLAPDGAVAGDLLPNLGRAFSSVRGR